ncbi:MAG: threonylcarbamoyl-AMP synthase [Dehalococcoidia bacterium]|nr:threonylcarbamoyl-AMP synthase [Dehalococcoidia bacterium]
MPPPESHQTHVYPGPMSATAGTQQIREAVEVLRRGGVIAFPTDTLYGLGAWAFSREGVERTFVIKGRPSSMALPLLLAEASQLADVAAEVPEVAWTLVRRFWPGALTLVLRKSPAIPDLVTGGEPTVAVRIPDHPVARELVRLLGAPITGTSANRTGAPPARTAQQVIEQLGDAVDLVVDGGECPLGSPSTVVDCTQGALRILREGAISREALEEALGAPLSATR